MSEQILVEGVERPAQPGETVVAVKKRKGALGFVVRLLRHRSASVGIFLLLIVIGAAIFAPLIAPYPIDKLSTGKRLTGSTWEHLFGTDQLGRDMFSRVIFGSQIALQVGITALLIAVTFGTLIGLVSGYYGGWVDTLAMRFVDLMLAFPGIFLALAIVTILGPGLVNGTIAIGISSIPGFARVIRGAVLSVKSQDYILAARAVGVPNRRILFRSVFPNVMPPLIVLATLFFPGAILAAAGLSYIGLGSLPPSPDWGTLLVDGQSYVRDAPWLFNFPGAAIFIVVMGSNLLGNGLRDVLDPRLRGL